MRSVWMLSATQALCMSGSFLVVLLGGMGGKLKPGGRYVAKDLFEAGHVIDARNLPSGDLAKASETLKKYKDKVVIACCETGMSSGAAVRALQAQGFEKAVNLRGGLQAWRADNLPLVKGDGRNNGKGKG